MGADVADHVRAISSTARKSFMLLPGDDSLLGTEASTDLASRLLQPRNPAEACAESGWGMDGMPEEAMPKPTWIAIRVVDPHPARKHVVPTSAVAAGRLGRDAIAVTYHSSSEATF